MSAYILPLGSMNGSQTAPNINSFRSLQVAGSADKEERQRLQNVFHRYLALHRIFTPDQLWNRLARWNNRLLLNKQETKEVDTPRAAWTMYLMCTNSSRKYSLKSKLEKVAADRDKPIILHYAWRSCSLLVLDYGQGVSLSVCMVQGCSLPTAPNDRLVCFDHFSKVDLNGVHTIPVSKKNTKNYRLDSTSFETANPTSTYEKERQVEGAIRQFFDIHAYLESPEKLERMCLRHMDGVTVDAFLHFSLVDNEIFYENGVAITSTVDDNTIFIRRPGYPDWIKKCKSSGCFHEADGYSVLCTCHDSDPTDVVFSAIMTLAEVKCWKNMTVADHVTIRKNIEAIKGVKQVCELEISSLYTLKLLADNTIRIITKNRRKDLAVCNNYSSGCKNIMWEATYHCEKCCKIAYYKPQLGFNVKTNQFCIWTRPWVTGSDHKPPKKPSEAVNILHEVPELVPEEIGNSWSTAYIVYAYLEAYFLGINVDNIPFYSEFTKKVDAQRSAIYVGSFVWRCVAKLAAEAGLIVSCSDGLHHLTSLDEEELHTCVLELPDAMSDYEIVKRSRGYESMSAATLDIYVGETADKHRLYGSHHDCYTNFKPPYPDTTSWPRVLRDGEPESNRMSRVFGLLTSGDSKELESIRVLANALLRELCGLPGKVVNKKLVFIEFRAKYFVPELSRHIWHMANRKFELKEIEEGSAKPIVFTSDVIDRLGLGKGEKK